MNLNDIVAIALQTLARNKMRTVLTMLGIIIGVAAVISTVAIGVGASDQVQAEIESLGENIIFVIAGSVTRNGVHLGSQATKTLTDDDGKAIVQQIPLVTAFSPSVGYNSQVVYGAENWYTSVRGVSPAYLKIRNWPLSEGSNFSDRDIDDSADICLVGTTVARNLFGNDDPVGKVVRISNLPFLIIGELAEKGESPFGSDQDDIIMAPYTTVQKKLAGVDWIHFMNLAAVSEAAIPQAEERITALLRQRHKLRPSEDDDFIIRSPVDFARAQQQAGQVMTLLLASIASVSLLVGGIGIMNIMLVSVTERTREIGVRVAVGATEQDVQRQFLSEALAISLLGGSIGVILGIFGSEVVSSMLHWPIKIPTIAVFIAVIFSAAVGIFFGYYPARKAAHLDPIEALRYE